MVQVPGVEHTRCLGLVLFIASPISPEPAKRFFHLEVPLMGDLWQRFARLGVINWGSLVSQIVVFMALPARARAW